LFLLIAIGLYVPVSYSQVPASFITTLANDAQTAPNVYEFDVYLRNPKQLPYSVYPRDQEFSRPQQYAIICNYIASMTDRFALDEHKRLFDPYQKV